MDDLIAQRRAQLEGAYPTWQPRTTSALFDAVADQYPERPHVMTDERVYSYAEMQAWSRRLARGLLALGIRPGEHVALILTNIPAFVAVSYALSRIGAIAIPLNYLYRAAELRYVLAQSQSVALITLPSFRDNDFLAALDQIDPGWEQRTQRTPGAPPTAASDALPHLRAVLTVASARPGVRSLADVEALGEHIPEAELERRERVVAPDATAVILYTSGTSGHPNSAILTHDMLLRSAYGSAWTRVFADGWRIAFALPLYHVFAYVEGLLAALFVGGAIVPQVTFEPGGLLRMIERHGATEALFVPTMTIAIVEAAAKGQYDLSTLESVMSAAAPAPVWLWERVQRELGVRQVYTGYGQTEVSASTTLTRPGDSLEVVARTVGHPKYGGVAGDPALGGYLIEYKTIDPFSGRDLAPGEEGELVVRGPIVTQGYYGLPEETRAALTADGWFRSGDLGRILPDGYLELTGRSRELYKCGGELVAPKEVEEVLTRHPAVSQAYVVGVPHARLGEIGCAWLVAADGPAPERRELFRLCRTNLARFKVPRYLLWIEATELPTTATGKVQKFRLIERACERLGLHPTTTR